MKFATACASLAAATVALQANVDEECFALENYEECGWNKYFNGCIFDWDADCAANHAKLADEIAKSRSSIVLMSAPQVAEPLTLLTANVDEECWELENYDECKWSQYFAGCIFDWDADCSKNHAYWAGEHQTRPSLVLMSAPKVAAPLNLLQANVDDECMKLENYEECGWNHYFAGCIWDWDADCTENHAYWAAEHQKTRPSLVLTSAPNVAAKMAAPTTLLTAGVDDACMESYDACDWDSYFASCYGTWPLSDDCSDNMRYWAQQLLLARSTNGPAKMAALNLAQAAQSTCDERSYGQDIAMGLACFAAGAFVTYNVTKRIEDAKIDDFHRI